MMGWLKNAFGGSTQQPGSKNYARNLLAASWEAYRLARRDRPREHNQPHPYSGDSAILSSHDMMNRRVRDLVRNTAQGKRIRQALTDLVIGTGFQTFSWPFLPSETFEIVTELESLANRMTPSGVVRIVGTSAPRIRMTWARRRNTSAGARNRMAGF